MNIRIKSAMVVSLLTILSISMLGASKKAFVIKRDGSRISADTIACDKRGNIIIVQGKIKRKLPRRDYKYAWVPMPSSIRKAYGKLKAKDYKAAASDFKQLYEKYKYVGWDVFCAMAGAQALDKSGDKNGAIAMLTQITTTPANPSLTSMFMQSRKLLATLYYETGRYSEALDIINKQLYKSGSDSLVASANNLYGDILLKQGKTKDAKLMYMRTALLFDSSNKKERPEALVKVIKILRQEKNNKALEFEKMLKNGYPGSSYLKNL